PDWRKSNITIFDICKKGKVSETKKQMEALIKTGRLPITENNIEIIEDTDNVSYKQLVNEKSKDAGLTIIGFKGEVLKSEKEALFTGYDSVGTLLFVNSHNEKGLD
ncbi:MAG: amino acid permease, partial [Ignavibacteria bacterium]|nr:amino acid permease [Ignavibacteria bacterium]